MIRPGPAGLVFLLLASGGAAELPNISSEQGKAMVYGPYLCHSVAFEKIPDINANTLPGAVARGLTVALNDRVSICYDLDRMAVTGMWTGGFLDTAKTHHTGYKGLGPPRPAGAVHYADPRDNQPLPGVRFDGHFLHGNNVILKYRVDGRSVLESPWAERGKWLIRRLEIGPGNAFLLPMGKALPDGVRLQHAQRWEQVEKDGDRFVRVPASRKTEAHALRYLLRNAGDGGAGVPNIDTRLTPMTRGGPPRWNQAVVTRGLRGKPKNGYAADELTVPLDNPWGAWMRLSAFDFFSDGRIAAATLSGDVWTASWKDGDISRIAWRRIATGLYEPLGLRIVDDKIYVRGRDRITRLHDLNADGEIDFYENFHSEGPVGQGYHAFIFDLHTDRAGNFYYAKSGRKCPNKSGVVRVDAKTGKHEWICTGFRHPNGMGAGGPNDWLLIGDNADGKFPAGASIVRRGKSYGYNAPMTEPMLYVLPPDADSSPGSMCWTDAGRFGPLSNMIAHTSYSKSHLFYVMVQDGVKHPNGFAVKMPWKFASSLMRARTNPVDGQLYLAAQKGWDSGAVVDGMIYRIRYTGEPAALVTGAKAVRRGIVLSFSQALNPALVEPDSFSATREGKKKSVVKLGAVKLLDPKTVLVEIPGLDPELGIDRAAMKKHRTDELHFRVMEPLCLRLDLETRDGTEIIETVYCTVNSLE